MTEAIGTSVQGYVMSMPRPHCWCGAAKVMGGRTIDATKGEYEGWWECPVHGRADDPGHDPKADGSDY